MKEEAVARTAAAVGTGTALGVATSYLAKPMPHVAHNAAMNLSAQGSRIATDAIRQSLANGSTVLAAVGAGAGAVGTAAAGGATAAVAATTAAAIAAAPVVLTVAAIGALGYGLYKLFED